ncbi:hypothetical protein HAX54_032659 [Datura stramonium]|uniref:Uncharacterized protein n=1 Tax=Datura stramonium TaxID=4076 RepID=A0ABS8VES7_DATST|nr:hypothetical protein [Datura stramonium]
MKQIRDLVAGLPHRPDDPSIGQPTYLKKEELQRYHDDQKKQENHLKKLETTYTALARIHVELKSAYDKLTDSHSRMRKRKKKRDEFFTYVANVILSSQMRTYRLQMRNRERWSDIAIAMNISQMRGPLLEVRCRKCEPDPRNCSVQQKSQSLQMR